MKTLNVLFVSSILPTDTSLHYYASLLKQGHRVLAYSPDFYRAHSPWEKLEQKLKKNPTLKRTQTVEKELLDIVSKNSWDLVFVMGVNHLSVSLLKKCQNVSDAKWIFHSHDNLFSVGVFKGADFFDTLKLYDRVFTTKSQNVERYKKLGQTNAHFIPSAFEPTVHRPISKKESRLKSEVGISFIGTYDKSRIPAIETLGWESLQVWGDHWTRYPGFTKHRDQIHPSAVYYFEFADITSQSKIALGLLREEADDLHTQRTFEIPACGTLQLAPRNSEILAFFQEDKEIVCFSSWEEMKEKAEYYLKHESACRKIAKAGFERCLSGGHTYADRVETILDLTLNEKTQGKKRELSAAVGN